MENLRIIKLEAENFKRLRAVEITPDGNMVVISGRNEQGKSSVLDAIWSAIGGKAGSDGLSRPIRDGEETAQVTVDLGEIIVTRKWTAKASYLTVENRDGAVFKSPQSMLDELVGQISFDPLAFSQMKEREQRETLLALVDLGLDLNEWERRYGDLYSERAEVNRAVKEDEGAAAKLPAVPEDTPDEEVSGQIVLDEMQAAQEIKAANDRKRQHLEALQNEARDKERDLNEARGKLEELKNAVEEQEILVLALLGEIDSKDNAAASLAVEIEDLEDPDLSVFQDKLARLETVNANVRVKQQRRDLEASAAEHRARSKEFTDRIKALEQEKADALAAANMPIADLGFDAEGVTYKGVPFSQASGAEKLRVSLAIAMAMNPTLRVIRIKDANDLDSTNWQLIKDMVSEKDFQCWCEVVDETGKLGVCIEDGAVSKQLNELEAK
ncbi:MAG: AAA family ATPase [Actinobacteria bacterium]|nr:AAA family ATPase [Actinomycetota bacterium]